MKPDPSPQPVLIRTVAPRAASTEFIGVPIPVGIRSAPEITLIGAEGDFGLVAAIPVDGCALVIDGFEGCPRMS